LLLLPATSCSLILDFSDKTGTTMLALSTSFSDDEVITCPGTAPSCPMLAADDYIFEVFPGVTGSVNAYTIAHALTP